MERVLQLATSSLASAEEHHNVGWGIFAYSIIIFAVVFALMFIAKAGAKGRVFKNPITQAAEQLYLFSEKLCVGVIGDHGRKYVPMIMTLWMLIFAANILGLILPHTPTADWSMNLALALIVFFYVQWEGMAVHYNEARSRGKDPVTSGVMGFFKHVRHFAGPNLGLALIPVTLLIFCIEIISELIKILSLSVRLYGNISAGHTAKTTLDGLAGGWPLGGLVLPLEFLVCIIQAFVFCLLTCVYIALVTHHEHEGDHGHDHDAEAPAAA